MCKAPGFSLSLCTITLLIVLGGISQPLHAQRLTGRVLEESTDVRVQFVELSLIDPTGRIVRSALSDSAGFFVLDAVPGRYTLRASRIGYAQHHSPGFELRPGEAIGVVIRLSVQGVPLQPLEIIARGREERGRDGFERRRALGKGVFLTNDSIKLRKPVYATDAFYNVPAIEVFEGMNPRNPSIFSLRGSKCLAVFLDHHLSPVQIGHRPDLRNSQFTDVRISDGLGKRPTLNELVSAERIAGIEIYRDLSEIPIELRTAGRLAEVWQESGWGSDRLCGFAWIWTKNAW